MQTILVENTRLNAMLSAQCKSVVSAFWSFLQEKPFYAQNSFVFPCFLTSYFCSKIVISLSWDLV